MARNKLVDLNNHLFAQLERLGEEDLSIEDLKKEVDRAKAINAVAGNIIDNAKTALEGAQFSAEYSNRIESIPEQFAQAKLDKPGT